MTNTENRKKLVEVKHLKQYFGSKKNVVKAIDDISFDIFEGETFGLVGESGSGKSTLLNIIAGLDSFNSGEIYAKNYEVHKLDEESLSNYRMNYLGLIFQFHYLFFNKSRISVSKSSDVGPAFFSSGFLTLLSALIIIKIAKAIIMKSITF